MVTVAPLSQSEVALRKSVDQLLSDSVEPWASRPGYAVFDDEECNVVNTKMQRLSIKTPSAQDTPEKPPEPRDPDDSVEARKRAPATYGEITSAGARQLFYHMGLSTDDTGNEEEEIVFVDLGSGRGKLILQAYMELPRLSKATGIELASPRHDTAVTAWTDLQSTARKLRFGGQPENESSSKIIKEATVEFLNEDFLEVDLSNVTHMYISSLCFPETLMYHIAAKLERDAPKLKCVATLRAFPAEFQKRGILDRTSYELVYKTFGFVDRIEEVEMTWTQHRAGGCPTYVYTKAPEFK
ncbi:Histone methylation protein DOT1 [Seminavis robusta]|uniref:Histone-lysine N-methyltransferase, H3 lysine-79 specific n=1 Tax=Seminavis robusta TaxID=568900 RepID=A0A9N8E9C1_9STRA|nr:Histone methylation protein DOT1 [Seminavis robusta]|eukprot:Sro691_g187850.1 Histone methylation protein DOT1 (298) ;mRNA; f:23734-24627